MAETTPNSPSVAGPTIVVDPARPTAGGPSVTPSAGKVPEFIADKMTQQEFDALPESARTVLVEKAKSVQLDHQAKTTALAQQRQQLSGLFSIQEQLEADPKLADHLAQSIKDYKAGRRGNGQAVTDDWEQLKEEADKDGLKVLQAIERRFSHSPVLEKLEALSLQLSQVVSGTQTSRRGQLEQELAVISPEFKALATEHKDAVIRLGLQPSMVQKSARDLIRHLALGATYEDAVFAERTRKSTEEVERAKTQGGFPSIAGAPETPVVTKDDFQESRDPRFGPQMKIGNVISRVFGEVRRHLPGI